MRTEESEALRARAMGSKCIRSRRQQCTEIREFV